MSIYFYLKLVKGAMISVRFFLNVNNWSLLVKLNNMCANAVLWLCNDVLLLFYSVSLLVGAHAINVS